MSKFTLDKLTAGMPKGVMAAVIVRRDTVEGMYHAVVRQQTAHDSYRDLYLEAPTEAALALLLRIHKPFTRDD